ncbi:efflux RND transporter periplasmic adaptor subunit [Corynebacterium matruchotii]|jgi:efflux transporter, RND family, MFP subunit|uniref:efflux RND transporter periplasmic adaptor subunit n=1 Tax=Corynebacterium matruchotii TaxID=43768 RepID=UPI002430DB67|nr:HlyD family efflux transporter periplasmic adaptor subunit [Corynebacterium matruchotii]
MYSFFANSSAITLASSDVQVLDKRDNSQRVAVSGNVEPQKSMVLSTRLTGPVNQLNVKVGDRVQADQLVANLDVTDKETELAKSKAQAATNEANSIAEIKGAESRYNRYKELLDNGMNQDINNAKAALRTAESAYDEANRNFQLESALRGNGKQQDIAAQQSKIENARQDSMNTNVEAARMGLKAVGTLQDQDTERRSLATEQSNLAELKAQLDGASPEQQVQIQAQIKASEERVETLQNSVNKQYRNTIDSGLDAADVTNKLQAADRNLRESQDSYEATLAQADNKLVTDQRNVAKTFEEKKDAATALAVAERNAQFQMEDNQAAIDNAVRNARAAQASNNAGDNQLKLDIASAQIRAPFDGVVTNVAAKQGSAANGALMTIADDARMIVHANVKEIDVAKIAVGQRVEFTTPGTGDKKFQGKVSFVSTVAAPQETPAIPASGSGSAGGSTSGGSSGASGSNNKVNFPVEIEVLGNKGTLRLGSTAKARIITREASDKMVIPQSAVYEDQGKKKVLAIAADDTIVERTVKLGSKTDFDVEVLSGEAKKGDKILVDAAKYRQSVGQKATVDTAAPGGADGAGASGASGTATSTAAAEVR